MPAAKKVQLPVLYLQLVYNNDNVKHARIRVDQADVTKH